jgi:hypothetical protein
MNGGSKVETSIDHQKVTEPVETSERLIQYRLEVRKLIDAEVQKVMDEEIKKATQALLDEQKNAIKQIVEEHRLVIGEIVEEEKKVIWERAEALRESIIKFGL